MAQAVLSREPSAQAGEQTRASSFVFWSLIAVVGVAQGLFAVWMNARGFLWGDAESRAASGLIALYSADPHLSAIGFVWMPLPTVLQLIPISFAPFWPEVVSSGFASSIVTVVAGMLTATIVFWTAQRFYLPVLLSAGYALVVSFSPMLFLFSTNGMSEGVAAPFLIGSVCSLLVFWHEGQRRYVAISGVLLALAFACVYQTTHFGAALLLALVVGLYTTENTPSHPQGRLRAIEGLGILLLVPVVYFALLWMIANAAIMGDPLYFATSSYSNEGYIAATGVSRVVDAVQGDVLGSLWFVVLRSLPFLIPLAPILLVRLMNGDLLRPNTATLLALALVVPLGLILPQVFEGQSFGWLRYFIYPLFVAAGWGLYEIARSRRRGLAATLILAGWLITVPASLWAMAEPELGQNEHLIVRNLLTGKDASETGYPMYFEDVAPVAETLNSLPAGDLILADASNAWTLAATVSRETLGNQLLLTTDRRFDDALADPWGFGIAYMLVPDPGPAPQDLINAEYPSLWDGTAEGFSLLYDFSETGQHWRLYRVEEPPPATP